MDTKERRKKYNSIRNLSSNAKKIVFRLHNLTEEAWNSIEFIMNSGKVPELIMRKGFKAKTKKYDVTGWTPFLYIGLKKAPFFLYGQSISITKVALFGLTKLVEKEIKGAKESEKEDLEQALFYFEELYLKLPTKMKGCATGKMKFIKYGKDKKTAHLLVKKADFEKEGPGSKEDFLDNINALELENSNKTKMVLSFVPVAETAGDVSETPKEAPTDKVAPSKPLSPAQKEKIKENVSKIGEQLEKIAKALKIEL